MKSSLAGRVFSCLSICLVLFAFSYGIADAQESTGAASQNSWYAAGMFNMHYQLPSDEGDYTEEGALSLDISPRLQWFAMDGLAVGADVEFSYFTHENFSDVNIGIGPRVSYFLRQTEWQRQLMPHIGCTFLYVTNDVDPGAEETGWRLKLGIGISPVIGGHLAVPVELGFMTERLTREINTEESYTETNNRLYLEVGIGAFIW